jgi:hypothetical protein
MSRIKAVYVKKKEYDFYSRKAVCGVSADMPHGSVQGKCVLIEQLTLMLDTQTGKNHCARVIASHLRACSEQALTYGQVLFILSQPARAHIWRTLTRFSSAWVCNARVTARDVLGISFSFVVFVEEPTSAKRNPEAGYLWR